jgi:hypothetical protein
MPAKVMHFGENPSDLLEDAILAATNGYSTDRNNNHKDAQGRDTRAAVTAAEEFAGIPEAFSGPVRRPDGTRPQGVPGRASAGYPRVSRSSRWTSRTMATWK